MMVLTTLEQEAAVVEARYWVDSAAGGGDGSCESGDNGDGDSDYLSFVTTLEEK